MNVMRDPSPLPVVEMFAVMAVVGPTAYFGLLDIGGPQPGETVVVSAAAGAVGSIVGQIAKIRQCRVVGLAGTDEKCRWIRDDLRFDAAVNYKKQDICTALADACPNGIDVYFDNVGGEILDVCLKLMNLNGRIPSCGLISQYNATGEWFGPRNYDMILRRLRVQGFIGLDYAKRYPEAIGVNGGNTGKLIVRVKDTKAR
jgi:NADPH-dependent curcumin reductase CurA